MQFLFISKALPPLNEKRFRAPENVPDWSMYSHATKTPSGEWELDASEKGAPCVQAIVQNQNYLYT